MESGSSVERGGVVLGLVIETRINQHADKRRGRRDDSRSCLQLQRARPTQACEISGFISSKATIFRSTNTVHWRRVVLNRRRCRRPTQPGIERGRRTREWIQLRLTSSDAVTAVVRGGGSGCGIFAEAAPGCSGLTEHSSVEVTLTLTLEYPLIDREERSDGVTGIKDEWTRAKCREARPPFVGGFSGEYLSSTQSFMAFIHRHTAQDLQPNTRW